MLQKGAPESGFCEHLPDALLQRLELLTLSFFTFPLLATLSLGFLFFRLGRIDNILVSLNVSFEAQISFL